MDMEEILMFINEGMYQLLSPYEINDLKFWFW